MRRNQLLEAFDRYQRQVDDFLSQIRAQDGVAYRVTDLSDASLTSDGDWDRADAEASYPNPMDGDTDDVSAADCYLFVPDGLDADNAAAAAACKAPLRSAPDAPIHTGALESALQDLTASDGDGFEDVSADVQRDAYDAVVAALVEAGVYDDTDDAPAFEASTDDGDVDGDAGSATAGADDVDPDDTPSDGRGDGVFAGHSLEASATGTVRFDADITDVLDASDGDVGDGLTGIIWGAGDHDLGLGGQPTPVHVPVETVAPTFEALQEDVAAGDVEIGLDHAPDDSVLAQTGLREFAVAEDVAMAADSPHIVMTESSFTANAALEAFQSGAFDQHDYSVVADVAVRTDDDGERATNSDGRIILDAVRITRIDVVQDGAVDAASVGAVPELAAGLKTVQAAAGDLNQQTVQDAVSALQASATALDDFSKTMKNGDIDPDDIDDLDAAREQLSAAADVIDDLQTDKDSLEAQADAFEDVASAHDVDTDDFDDVSAAAQAVVDAQTTDIRESIASIEAELPNYDTDDSDVEARAEDLAGQSKADLENTLNARKAEKLDAVEAQQNKGRAATQGDQSSGRSSALQASGSGDADADDVALSAMGGRDRIEQQASDLSPSEFVAHKYDVQASQYDAPDELADDMNAAAAGGEN